MRGGVVLAGFSQGGMLALTVAMRHPEHVALVLPLAAWAPPQLRTVPAPDAPPIRWLHGLDDDRIPYELALDTATDLRTRGYDVELLGYPGARHEMTPAEEIRLHTWLARALQNLVAERPIDEGFVLVP
jgi:phospholipase/carboxylesterase